MALRWLVKNVCLAQEEEQAAGLLAGLEEERAALQQANTTLQLKAGIRGQGRCTEPAYRAGQSAAIDELHRLREELQREKLQRNQAEQDFEELLGTIDELQR